MKGFRNVLSIFMSVVLAVGLMPLPAFAENGLLISGQSNDLKNQNVEGAELDDEDSVPDACAVLYRNGDFVFQPTTSADGSDGHSEEDVLARYEDASLWPVWDEEKLAIKAVSVNGRVKIYNAYNFFGGCTNLQSADLRNLDVSSVTDMSWLFYECFSLTSVNLSGLDASSLCYIICMFYDCRSLEALDLSDFKAPKLEDVGSAFSDCRALTSIDLSSFNMSKVDSDEQLFLGAPIVKLALGKHSAPKSTWCLPEGSWALENGNASFDSTDDFVAGYKGGIMAGVWSRHIECAVLYSNGDFVLQNTIEPDGGLGHASSDVVESYVDVDAKVLEVISEDGDMEGPKWWRHRDGIKRVLVNGSVSVASADWWFADCNNLETADLGGFKARCTEQMFSCCENLQFVDASRWETSNTLNMNEMFVGCEKLTRISIADDTVLHQDCGLELFRWTLANGDASFSNTWAFIAAMGSKSMAGTWIADDGFEAYDLSLAKISVASQVYTGKARKPVPTVTYNGVRLRNDRDYYVESYKKNTNAGVATVTIEGFGNFDGTVTVKFTIAPASIKNAKLVLSKSVLIYNKKVQKPTVKTVGGKALKSGTDYTVKYSNAKSTKVGSYTVQVTGKGNYAGTSAKATYKILNANPVKVTVKKPSVSLAKVKKAKQVVAAKNAFAVSGNKGGKVTYKKASGDKAITVASNGNVTVAKGAKKGAHSVKVTASVAAKGNYAAATKTVTLKVTVK